MTNATPSPRRVLCAVDVQREARGALAVASVLAEHFEAHLDGLYVALPTSGWDNQHAARASAAVLTVPGDSPACALRRILLLVTTPQATEPARAWASTLARRFDASLTSVQPGAGARSSWSGLGRGRALHAEHDADGVAALVDGERFDLVVVGLPVGGPQQERSKKWVERLRRIRPVPTLTMRGLCPASSQLSARGRGFVDGGGIPLEQSA